MNKSINEEFGYINSYDWDLIQIFNIGHIMCNISQISEKWFLKMGRRRAKLQDWILPFLFDWLKILIWNRRHTSIYIQERKRRGKRVWAKTRGPAHGPKHKIHISVIMKLKMLTCNEEKGLNDRIRLLIEFHLFFLVY